MVRRTATWIVVATSAFAFGCVGGRTELESPSEQDASAQLRMDAGSSTDGLRLDGQTKLDSVGGPTDAGRMDTRSVTPDAAPDTRLPVDTRPRVDSRPAVDSRVPADTRVPVDSRVPVDTRVPVDSRVDAQIACAQGGACTTSCTTTCNVIGTMTCTCLRGSLQCGSCEIPPVVISETRCPEGASGSACGRSGTMCSGGADGQTGCLCVAVPPSSTSIWLCL